MPLVTTREMLTKAQRSGYAVGAFNIENMEMAQAVISAAEETGSPVIAQTTPSTLRYAPPGLFLANVRAMAEESPVPVAMHLDHGDTFDLAMRCYRAGYTSVMIDGSKLPFKENAVLSKKVADACHAGGIPVEAELGKVGGKEDDLSVKEGDPFTDPDEAARFAKESQVDFLAVAIGTAHGIYKGTPKLDLDRLSAIRERVDIPLVLHGTSGVPDTDVRECVRRGICKVNYATDLRIAFTKGVKEIMAKTPDVYDPKKYNAAGREEVKRYVIERMTVLGSAGRA